MKKFTKKSKKNQESANNKQEVEVVQKKEEEKQKQVESKNISSSKRFNWLGATLGTLFFFGSSFGLFFLYKLRNKFIK